MLFPYSCNAPVYHLPIGTVSLIVANIVVFLGLATGHLSPFDGWILEYGTGLHAEQWLLSTFAHTDLSHLLGNMIFLWLFGLVTEGKIGWYRFLLCYLLIAVGESAFEQFIYSSSASVGNGSVGASAAVFGLMAMACVWAPMNEVSFFFLFFFRVYTFEISIGVLSIIYLCLNLVEWFFIGTMAGSPILHLMGMFAGTAIGIVLLKRGVVDCENWDLFAVFSGNYGPYAKKKELEPLTEEETQRRNQSQSIDAERMFRALLASNQSSKALSLRRKMIDLEKSPPTRSQGTAGFDRGIAQAARVVRFSARDG